MWPVKSFIFYLSITRNYVLLIRIFLSRLSRFVTGILLITFYLKICVNGNYLLLKIINTLLKSALKAV